MDYLQDVFSITELSKVSLVKPKDGPPPQPHLSFLHLPHELHVTILNLLDVVDLLACKLVCKAINQMLTQDPYLLYRTEAVRTRYTPDPGSDTLSIPEHLRRMQDLRTAWNTFSFSARPAGYRAPKGCRPVRWSFKADMLIVAYRSRELDAPEACFDFLYMFHLSRSNSDRPVITQKTLTGNAHNFMINFVIAPANDSVIVLGPRQYGVVKLTTGEGSYYPSCFKPTMSFWQLEMYGTLLVGHKPYSTMDKETEVYVIPFANDFQMLRHKLGRSDVGAAVISREHLVQPIFGPGPWSQLRLKVSRFQWSSADTLDVNLSATFCLPLTRQNSSGPFKCRPFSSPEQRPTYVPGPYQKAAPHPAPAPMLAFEIVLKDLEKDKDKDKIYTVFAYTAPLLAPRRQDHTVPWNEWGRRSTFWFHGRFEKASMHGYHVLYKQGTKTVLLDFTPSEVACRRGAIPASCIVEGTTVQTPGVEITTTAAFVRIESDGLDYTEYILGENIIALKNPQDLRDEDDAFTVLFPAVKKNVQSSISYTSSERARKLGRASSRGPEAPIVVYNNPARCIILSLSKGDRHLSSQIKCFGKTVRSSGYGIYFSVYISRLTSNTRTLTAKTIVAYTYVSSEIQREADTQCDSYHHRKGRLGHVDIVSKAVRFVTAVQIATEKRPTKITVHTLGTAGCGEKINTLRLR
ncbi:predicted protein [Postia placenta Mad-698-R]|nr:predicted protein [Postia placenta Mad-698-R]